jgi:hypothetical protein
LGLFGLGFCFGLFDMGNFGRGKELLKGIAEGKRIAKEGLIESLHREL